MTKSELTANLKEWELEHLYSLDGSLEPDKFSYISKFHIIISCKLIVYIVMCFYQETN